MRLSQTSLLPIAPKAIESTNQLDTTNTNENSSSAQLLIRMPTGKTIKLSQIPFYPKEFEGAPPNDQLVLVEKAKPKSANSQKNKVPTKNSQNSDLKERNKAAALRSRMKRKNKTEAMTHKMEEIMKQNKSLQSENQLLKKEVVRLKEKLKQIQPVDDL